MLNSFVGSVTASNLSEYKGPGSVSLFLYLLFFIVVLFMAYYATRIISKNYSDNFGKNIKIIEKLALGADKSLLIVKVGEDYYLLSNGKMGIEKLDKLEGFTPISNDKVELDFKKTFDHVMKRHRK